VSRLAIVLINELYTSKLRLVEARCQDCDKRLNNTHRRGETHSWHSEEAELEIYVVAAMAHLP
jgi:hypothetical protein